MRNEHVRYYRPLIPSKVTATVLPQPQRILIMVIAGLTDTTSRLDKGSRMPIHCVDGYSSEDSPIFSVRDEDGRHL